MAEAPFSFGLDVSAVKGFNVKTHDQLVKRLIRRPGVRAEVQRIEREAAELPDALLKARQEAGLTQAQVAKRMGTQGPGHCASRARAGNREALPSVATLRKYVKACGKRLVLRVA